MKTEGMTKLQREALEHVEKASQEGLSIGAYARAHEIPAQQIYDAVARLRRRGTLPGHSAKRGKFIAVKITPSPSMSGANVCRILVPGGLVIECLQWPPRSWLHSLAGTADAAT
jgi:hypothetical protein